jgi:restriction system protein
MRRGYYRVISAAARLAERERRELVRARIQAERARVRDERIREKENKKLYLESRATEAEELTRELEHRVHDLSNLLRGSLASTPAVNFHSLKTPLEALVFSPGKLAQPIPAPDPDLYKPAPLSFLKRLFPSNRQQHQQAVENGKLRFGSAVIDHARREAARETELAEARQRFDEAEKQKELEVQTQHAEIEQFESDVDRRVPEAVSHYFSILLESQDYPDGFPEVSRVAVVPESSQAVIEYDLPGIDVVPDLAGLKYVKSRDEIVQLRRPESGRRNLYASVLGQVVLRSIREIFESPPGQHLESIVFNGHVETIDRGTGKKIHPCLISVRTTRDAFSQIDLQNVEPIACLKVLNAAVSPSPTELIPVRPILEFKMVDPRFVAGSDVLASLDQRPNLMELSPTEFESLISNLFSRMGLETRQTRPSRDGGVDCVAYDSRPILGGKVVIQAKRYKNTVGVSAVRDLFGTLQNEGASKGILVTTSGYGRAAFEFADGKPIELLSGSHLLSLLAEHAGIQARIVPPDDWRDPVADTPGQD